MSQGKIQAFIFDMDGTLVDNANFHTQAWAELLMKLELGLNR